MATIQLLEYDQQIGFWMSFKNLVLIKIWIIIVLGKGKYYLYLYLVRWGCTFLGQGSKVWYLLLFPSWRKLLFGNESLSIQSLPNKVLSSFLLTWTTLLPLSKNSPRFVRQFFVLVGWKGSVGQGLTSLIFATLFGIWWGIRLTKFYLFCSPSSSNNFFTPLRQKRTAADLESNLRHK